MESGDGNVSATHFLIIDGSILLEQTHLFFLT